MKLLLCKDSRSFKNFKKFLKKYFKRLTVFIRVYIEDIMKLNPDGVLNIITNFEF